MEQGTKVGVLQVTDLKAISPRIVISSSANARQHNELVDKCFGKVAQNSLSTSALWRSPTASRPDRYSDKPLGCRLGPQPKTWHRSQGSSGDVYTFLRKDRFVQPSTFVRGCCALSLRAIAATSFVRSRLSSLRITSPVSRNLHAHAAPPQPDQQPWTPPSLKPHPSML